MQTLISTVNEKKSACKLWRSAFSPLRSSSQSVALMKLEKWRNLLMLSSRTFAFALLVFNSDYHILNSIH